MDVPRYTSNNNFSPHPTPQYIKNITPIMHLKTGKSRWTADVEAVEAVGEDYWVAWGEEGGEEGWGGH